MAEREDVDPLWDNWFRSKLKDLATSGSRPLQPASWVRRVHRARRVAAAGGSGVLVAAVVLTGFAIAEPSGTGQGMPAGTPTTSPTAPTDTPTPSETRPVTDGPTTEPSTEPRETGAVVAGPTIPAGLELPHEGETSENSDFTDWAEGFVPRSWHYSPCDGAAVSTGEAGASDVRSIEQSGPEYMARETLVVFPEVDGAVRLMQEVRAQAAACEPYVGPDGGTWVVQSPLDGAWGEGLVVAKSYVSPESTVDEPVYGLGGEYLLMARTGSAVMISEGYREWQPAVDSPNPGAVEEHRKPLDTMAPHMCVFTVDGC